MAKGQRNDQLIEKLPKRAKETKKEQEK